MSSTLQARPKAERGKKPEKIVATEKEKAQAKPRRFAFERHHLWYVLIYAIIVACYFFYKDRLPDWDEPYHLDFIEAIRNLILQGKFTSILGLYQGEKFSGLAMLPGYHILGALFSIKFPSVQSLRLINVGFLFLLVVIVSRIQKRIFQRNDYLKLVCFAFFPVTFTHALLIYTDYATLFFVILAFYCELEGLYICSGLALLLGFFTRQSIVTWVVFLPMLAYCLREPLLPESWTQELREILRVSQIKACLKKYWFHLVLLAAFVVFVILNHGIAVGDKEAQPSGAFSIGNIFNFCLFSFVFFLPGAIWNFRQHVRNILRSDVALGMFLLAFVGFMFLYPGPQTELHIYNTWLDHRGTFFIRNNIIHWVANHITVRVLAFLCAVIGFLEINRTLSIKVAALMTFATVTSLAPLVVTDIRYAMIPLGLYVILRNETNRNLHKLQTIWLFLMSMTWLWGVKMELFTPF